MREFKWQYLHCLQHCWRCNLQLVDNPGRYVKLDDRVVSIRNGRKRRILHFDSDGNKWKLHSYLHRDRDGECHSDLYDHGTGSGVLQYDEHIHWAGGNELCLVGIGQWDAVRFKHGFLYFGGSRSFRFVHDQPDDLI